MKTIQKTIFLGLLISLIFPVSTLAITSAPTLPLLVYGDAIMYGSALPIGTVVSVEKNGTEIASTSLTTAGKYFINIPASYAGSLLTYKIGAKVFAEKICANPLLKGSDRIDLILTETTTSGGSGGGGGGGGGGGYSVTPKSSDINGDGKVDKYDFSLMMANWGKTGANGSDLNNDGKVDKYDFALLMSKWSSN